jgi:hypothetical protein
MDAGVAWWDVLAADGLLVWFWSFAGLRVLDLRGFYRHLPAYRFIRIACLPGRTGQTVPLPRLRVHLPLRSARLIVVYLFFCPLRFTPSLLLQFWRFAAAVPAMGGSGG